MATEISSIADIQNLKHINGISVREIERRARPLKRTTNHEFAYDAEEIARTPEEDNYVHFLRLIRSSTGFLNDTESFQEVLQRDWHTVERLGTSHIEIAQHLKKLLELCGSASYNRFVYSTDSVTNNTIKQIKPQRIEMRHLVLRGDPQYSLFTNLEKDQSEEYWWVDEYHIRNFDLGLEIKVAGNAQHGIIPYIEKYGFYEGGQGTNDFRIDPVKFVVLISGRWDPSVLASEITSTTERLRRTNDQAVRLQTQIMHLKESKRHEQEQLQAMKGPGANDQDLETLQSTIEELEGEILLLEQDAKKVQQQVSSLEQRLNYLDQQKAVHSTLI